MLNLLLFYLKATFVITFSKSFRTFEKEYIGKSSAQFFLNGDRKLTDKEKEYIEIIHICYTYL